MFAVERALVAAPRLERCVLSGCSALEIVRISGAECRAFVARACRSLTEVRFERGTRALDVFDARNSALRRVVASTDVAASSTSRGARRRSNSSRTGARRRSIFSHSAVD